MKNVIIPLFLVIFFSLPLFLSTAERTIEETPWEWSVYRIQVHLEVDKTVLEQFDARNTDEFIEKLTPSFLETVRNWVGGLWSLSFTSGRFPQELYNDALPCEEISPSVLEKYPFFRETLDSPFDKFIYVNVAAEEDGTKISVRELDVRTLTAFGRSSKIVQKNSDFNDILCDAMLSVFSLSANIEQVNQKKVVLQVRGGELVPDSVALQSLTSDPILVPGSLFVPFLRTWNRNREVEVVKAIPWTALVVESVDRSRIECRLESGLRQSLSIRRRGRSEQIAILPRLTQKETTLRLVPRIALAKKRPETGGGRPEGSAAAPLSDQKSKEDVKSSQSNNSTNRRESPNPSLQPPASSLQPLLGKYRLFEKTPENEKGEFLGTTNPDGTFTVPYSSDTPIRQLLVRDGAILIARLPLIQGWSSEYVVGVPDDEVRILAEGTLQGIQEEVLDLIALREILKARIAKAQQTNNSELLTLSKREYERLKRPQQILTELDVAQRKYSSSDPIVQRRLDIMFDATRKVISQYQE